MNRSTVNRTLGTSVLLWVCQGNADNYAGGSQAKPEPLEKSSVTHLSPQGCHRLKALRRSGSHVPDDWPDDWPNETFVLADFKVNRCSRRCHALSRPLKDGEWYYSVVVESGDDLVRRDYSAEAWTGPPEGTVGWWKGRMPEAGTRKLVLAPDPVLIDLLRGLGDSPDRQPLRFLMALLLLRRRVVTELETIDNTMRLRVNADNSELEIVICKISTRQTEELQSALQDLLYCEAAE
jgi:hypothetical protein